MITHRRYCCRFCGQDVPAWLYVPQAPNRWILRMHLMRQHPTEAQPYLNQIRTPEDVAWVEQTFEVIGD
jgi:hypothetical protein